MHAAALLVKIGVITSLQHLHVSIAILDQLHVFKGDYGMLHEMRVRTAVRGNKVAINIPLISILRSPLFKGWQWLQVVSEFSDTLHRRRERRVIGQRQPIIIFT